MNYKPSIAPVFCMPHNGYMYGVVWRFEARTCQIDAQFIRCNARKFGTNHQNTIIRPQQQNISAITIQGQSPEQLMWYNDIIPEDRLFRQLMVE